MSATGQRSMAEVAGDIVGNIQKIVRAEIRLARAEAGEELRGSAGGDGAVAAVAALFGVMYVLLALVYTLALWLPLWAAALLVGLLMLATTAISASIGVKSLKVPGLPRTTRSLKENLT